MCQMCKTNGRMNKCIHVEKVITGHTRLARNTGGDEDDLCALESLLEAIVVGKEALGLGWGVDVAGDGSMIENAEQGQDCQAQTHLISAATPGEPRTS